MDRTELAWAAGFWDGEGSAYLSGAKDRTTKQPCARINQAGTSGVPEVLTRFRSAVGFGSIGGPEQVEGRDPLYRWEVSSRSNVARVLELLAPWLGPVKRLQLLRTLGLGDGAFADRMDQVGFPDALAWAAGFFDGEGSIYLDKHNTHAGYVRLEAAITQSDPIARPFVLLEFERIVGIGKIYGPFRPFRANDAVYRWKAHRAPQIIGMIEQLRPWLGRVKRTQADRCIAIVTAQPALPRGNPAWGNRKTHCVKGHDYATARIRPFRSRGKDAEPRRDSKQCLRCVRDSARAKRIRDKQKSRG